MAPPMLEVQGLNQFYGGSHILRDLAFTARVGEVTVVLGRNGVGKTTLLKSLMGVVPAKTGSVALDGRDITRAAPYERVRAGMGYVPQGREIFGRLTVEENLRMGLATQPGATAIPAELFELFPVLQQMLHRRGGDLSGGQQQQLAIARALAMKPQALLFDEPTSALDPRMTGEIGSLIRDLARDRLSILVVTHDMGFARRVADRVCVFDKGAIAEEGEPESVFKNPQSNALKDLLTETRY